MNKNSNKASRYYVESFEDKARADERRKVVAELREKLTKELEREFDKEEHREQNKNNSHCYCCGIHKSIDILRYEFTAPTSPKESKKIKQKIKK